jgi:hypothetical protein
LFDDDIYFCDIIGGIENEISLGMVLRILPREINFGVFPHGCREENYLRSICSDHYILDNGDS